MNVGRQGVMKQSILIIVAIITLIVLALVGFGFWGWGLFAGQAKEALNNNAVILQHIGEIDRIETDFEATGEAPGDEVFVFKVEGSKGSGVVTAEFITVDADTERVESGTLQLASGEIYDLLEEEPFSADGEIIEP